MTKDKGLQEDIRTLTLERIKASSRDLRVSIGAKDYTKKELLENVRRNSEVGQEVMEAQIGYLRDMAKGKIYQDAYGHGSRL